MMEVIPVDVFDKDGNMLRIDFLSAKTGEFQFEAVWDINDEQTTENRIEFRKWADQMAKNLKFNPIR